MLRTRPSIRTALLALALALCIAPASASASTGSDFMAEAHQIWTVAAPYYGQASDSPMPSTRIVSNRLGPRPRTVRLANGTSQAWFTRRNAQGLLNGAPASQEWLIHEWAHVFQEPGLTSRAGEGGAQAFARFSAPKIYAALGIPFSQPWSRVTDGYVQQMDFVQRVLGWDWIQSGQWGPSS